MRVYKASSPEGEAALREVVERRNASNENALRVADAMIAGVRARGDAYVAEQIAKFDGVTLAPEAIKVAPRAVTIGDDIAEAIDTAIARIEAFHRPQLPASYRWNSVAHRVRPLRRVGCYVPGGRAVYISTLMMTAVPARIAGVAEIVCITTPAAADRDELHYVCNRLGITEIYRCGGAAGVAAAALGTASLARVDKVVGPGNAYVTAAKMRLIGEVGIDMTAGPTELIVVADECADASLVIADLMAQAEHGPDSEVILLTTSRALAERMPERAIAFVVDSLDEAVTVADQIAPEHLSIHAHDAEAIAETAQNCAAIYCGASSPPAAGDYVVGSNHVLPTAGSARFFSPLGVYDFVKRSNVVSLTHEELMEIAPLGERIANFEGLPNHARSMAARRDACLAAS
jgi:histidinol dehydrogenase